MKSITITQKQFDALAQKPVVHFPKKINIIVQSSGGSITLTVNREDYAIDGNPILRNTMPSWREIVREMQKAMSQKVLAQ